jgi:ketosteroid isomerase-like protein
VTQTLDVATVQQALDALIIGDQASAAERFTEDVVLTGVGGCLGGRTKGLSGVLDRFAEISRLTHGTFGSEVEAVYTGSTTEHVVVTRHWASIDGQQIIGAQALLVTVDSGRIRSLDALSPAGAASGIWD